MLLWGVIGLRGSCIWWIVGRYWGVIVEEKEGNRRRLGGGKEYLVETFRNVTFAL